MTDKERLDWLSVATVDVKSPHGLRAAIDAAMERERQG
jgi:hypothetical protein